MLCSRLMNGSQLAQVLKEVHLLCSAVALACMQYPVILQLDFLAHHHQCRFLGTCAQLELHLQPAELPLHILDARVIVGYTPAYDASS